MYDIYIFNDVNDVNHIPTISCKQICTALRFIRSHRQQRRCYRPKKFINNFSAAVSFKTVILFSLKTVHLYRNMRAVDL